MTFISKVTRPVTSAFTSPFSVFDAVTEGGAAAMLAGSVLALFAGVALWFVVGVAAVGLAFASLTELSKASSLRIAAEIPVVFAVVGFGMLLSNLLSLQLIALCSLPLMVASLLFFRREQQAPPLLSGQG